jgi:hypothetical protein
MAIRTRRPANPVPRAYVPPNTKPHKVKTGDSLDSIARQHGLSWQALARLNWKTNVPDEINWYLGHYVGCTAASPDGYNYSFRDSDSPGLIYVPDPAATAPGGGAPGQPGGTVTTPQPIPVGQPATNAPNPVARRELNTLVTQAVRLPLGHQVPMPRAMTLFKVWLPTNTGGQLLISTTGSGTVDLRRAPDAVLKPADTAISYDVPTGEFGAYHVLAKGKPGDTVICSFVQISFARDGTGDSDPPLIPWNFYYWPSAKQHKQTGGTTVPNVWVQRAKDVMDHYSAAFSLPDLTAASKWEEANHARPDVGEGWEGHCHNSAPASMYFEEPTLQFINHVAFSSEEMEFLATEYFGNFGQLGPDFWELKRGNSKPGGANGRFYLPAFFKPGGPKTRAEFIRALTSEGFTNAAAIADSYIQSMGGEAAFAQQIKQWHGELAAEFYDRLIKFMRVKKHPLLSNMRSYRGGGGPHEVWNQAYFFYRAYYYENPNTKDPMDILVYCDLFANLDTYPSVGLPAQVSGSYVIPDSTKALFFSNIWRIQFTGSGDIVIADKRNEWRNLQNNAKEELYPPTEMLTLAKPATSRKPGDPFSLGNQYIGTDLVTKGHLKLRKRYQ